MTKRADFRFDGTTFLLTIACTTPEEAEDVAALIGKMGITDVETATAPIVLSDGDNSGTKMKHMVAEEIFNWILANPS